jgi:E3 ubiquitin-protein ligase DMA1/2
VADLEAELDDPSGEWEEVDPAEGTMQTPQDADSEIITQQPRREINSSEGTGVLVEPPQSSQSQSHRDRNGDMEVAEASDDSSVDAGIIRNPENFSNLHINDEPPSPSDSEVPAQHTSNATVAPVDIISRKPVPGTANATSSRLGQPSSHQERTSTRTPSPNGLSSLAGDALAGAEGPMTPRNDAGPFIFDGSAGRGADVQLAALATLNLTAAAETPPATTPQPAV